MSLQVKKVIKNILFALCLCSCSLGSTSSTNDKCLLQMSKSPTLRPNILLKIGTRKVDLKVNKWENFFWLYENQEIEIQCKTKFETPEQIKEQNVIGLKCLNGRLHKYGPDYEYYDSQIYDSIFACSAQKWNLYEAYSNFNWCPSDTTSYLLARPTDSPATMYQNLAGICYDLNNLSFKSLYYKISPKHSEHLHPTGLSHLYTPAVQLEHFSEIFGFKGFAATDFEQQEIQDWAKDIYNSGSIIQNTLLQNEFIDGFASLLDVPWWPNLRLGNWKRYEAALRRQVEDQHQSYDILAGVSAIAKVPIYENCRTNFTLKNTIYNGNNGIPLYVWNYLRSTRNSSDEIVIIGVNSPFYELYSESDIVFCPDICEDISWLNKTSSTFRYSALGIMFCCSSEDVKLSRHLDGFPESDINAKPPITKHGRKLPLFN